MFCLLQGESEFCLLLALPCGRDQDDVLNQTQALRTAFINYLQAKLAAGIINVPNPGSNQVSLLVCYCRCLSVFANIQPLLVFDNILFVCKCEVMFYILERSLDCIVFQLIHFYRSSPACLCVADIPTMWVFGEPLIPASPWPPQPDLQYLPSPHDCHHLCVTSHPPVAGKRNHLFSSVDVHQVEPQETRGMPGSLLLETLGTFGNNVLFKPFPSHLFFFSSHLAGIFVLLKRASSGMD